MLDEIPGFIRPTVLALLFTLGACSSPAPIADNACPPIEFYTGAQETQAQAELLALPPDSVIAHMIVDYGHERAMLRACRAQSVKK